MNDVAGKERSEGLVARLRAGEMRALGRVISKVESGSDEGQELLAELRSQARPARLLGVTGAPGSGKSTLTDSLIGAFRDAGERVAVVAVDPSSPFSGGAILGDRIRMTRWHRDPDVFIRSMASRGHLGGLAAATMQVVSVLEAAGFGTIIIETVGVGQSEVEIAHVADTTVLVLTPGQGDTVQTFKAGIMEIADLFVINKADHPEAHRLKREIRAMLQIALADDEGWQPPIVETIASRGEGVSKLMAGLDEHGRYLRDSGELEGKRRRRARFEIAAVLQERLGKMMAAREELYLDDVLAGRLTPAQAVAKLLES